MHMCQFSFFEELDAASHWSPLVIVFFGILKLCIGRGPFESRLLSFGSRCSVGASCSDILQCGYGLHYDLCQACHVLSN